MKTVDVINNDVALRLAYKLQITYYDASYIVASIENNARLITDDVKLVKKIREKH